MSIAGRILPMRTSHGSKRPMRFYPAEFRRTSPLACQSQRQGAAFACLSEGDPQEGRPPFHWYLQAEEGLDSGEGASDGGSCHRWARVPEREVERRSLPRVPQPDLGAAETHPVQAAVASWALPPWWETSDLSPLVSLPVK